MLLAGGLPLALTRYAGDALGRRRPGVVIGLARWVGRMSIGGRRCRSAAIMVGFGLAGATPRAAWFIAAVVVAASLIQRVSVGRAQRAAEVASGIRRRRGHGRGRRCLDGPRARAGGGIVGMFAVEAAVTLASLVWLWSLSRHAEATLGAPEPVDPPSAATSCATPSSPRWA